MISTQALTSTNHTCPAPLGWLSGAISAGGSLRIRPESKMPNRFEEVREELKTKGVSLRRLRGEARHGHKFCVNVKGGKEETAHYTNDLEDALAAGVRMAENSPFFRLL
jgi:hypothetical protein